MPTAAEFRDVLVATRDHITTAGAVDNVTRPDPVGEAILPNFKSGHGESLTTILETGENTSAEWTDRSGTHSTELTDDVLAKANTPWSKMLVSHVRLAYQDLETNAGPEALAKLAAIQMKNATRNHRLKISHALTALDGDVAAGAPISLDQLVSDKKAIAGVSPADEPCWKATRLYRPSTDGTISEGLRDLVDSIEDNGGDTSGLILLAGNGAFRDYESELDPKVRYNSLQTGDTRFRQVEFDGLTLRRCYNLQSDRVYAINASSLVAEYLNDNFMKVLPAREVPGNVDFWTPIVSIMALSTTRRADHGVLILGDEPADRTA